MKILITMHAVSEWGGLHENIYFAAKSLAASGHKVDVLCTGTRLADLLVLHGIGVLRYGVDEDSESTARRVAEIQRYDLVYCHPFVAREIGLLVAGILQIPLVATFHGNYLDAVSTWHRSARAITTVSPALGNMLLHQSDIDPQRIVTIRNGVEDRLFDMTILSLEEKLEVTGGIHDVVLLARLDPDKRPLWEALVRSMAILAAEFPARKWRIRIPGDGKGMDAANRLLSEFVRAHENLEIEWLGWVGMNDVPLLLRRSSLAFASGRGAAQSIAVGTPAIAAGSQASFGLQVGERLDLGLWGNFGGFPIGSEMLNSDAGSDLVNLFQDSELYRSQQAKSRGRIEPLLKQSRVDLELRTLLEFAAS